MSRATPSIALALAAVASIDFPVAAADVTHYRNARYGYAITVPDGFGPIVEADNGDGGRSSSAIGNAELAVWGANVLDGGFTDEAGSRRRMDEDDGWRISYSRFAAGFAAYSGTRRSRILYQRALPGCRGQAIFFRLEYDASAKRAVDPVVAGLTRSFKRAGDCGE